MEILYDSGLHISMNINADGKFPISAGEVFSIISNNLLIDWFIF